MALVKDPASLTNSIDGWLLKHRCPKAGNHKRGNPKHQPESTLRRPPRNYNQGYTESGLRASAFKKVQDLFSKNRTGLVDSIISGKPIICPEEFPSIAGVKELYLSRPSTTPTCCQLKNTKRLVACFIQSPRRKSLRMADVSQAGT